jgi:hypothetical protein
MLGFLKTGVAELENLRKSRRGICSCGKVPSPVHCDWSREPNDPIYRRRPIFSANCLTTKNDIPQKIPASYSPRPAGTSPSARKSHPHIPS